MMNNVVLQALCMGLLTTVNLGVCLNLEDINVPKDYWAIQHLKQWLDTHSKFLGYLLLALG